MARKLGLLFTLITTICSVLAPTRSLSIIWPLDCPADFPGDSSQQHKISGLFGEYRPTDSDHFHGGIDMPDYSDTPVYSVLTGVVVDTNSVYQRIAIRNEWDPSKYVWDDFRYVHVYWINEIAPEDSIIDDLTRIWWYLNPETGNWEWPRHLPIAYIIEDHLHFERVYYDNYPGGDFPDGYYYKWNPFLCGRTCLKPFSDTTAPKFDTVSTSTDWIKFYDRQYGMPQLRGQGTYEDPFLVPDSFDVRIHAHDEINDETKPSGAPYHLAVYEIYWELRWEGFSVIDAYSYPFRFPYSSKINESHYIVKDGIEFIYDTLESTMDTISEHYYWITNIYDNEWDEWEGLYFEGGKDSCIIAKDLLFNENEYLFKICLFDIKGNYTCNSVWIRYTTTGVEDGEDFGGGPEGFSLSQNYPNPFNPTTTIPFIVQGKKKAVNSPIHIKLNIYNLLGQRVKTLVDEPKAPGFYNAIWDGKDDKGEEVASGIYLYKLEADDFKEVKKMILLK